MIDSGDYLWNSGMFLFKVTKLLDIVKEINLDLFNNLYQISQEAIRKSNEIQITSKLWRNLDNVSFDVAVMENIKNRLLQIHRILD